ncbi:hypothetical protein [Celerinatantimonas yamalensis]|uniref:Lrp/AsnC family transcriptional regulator n=1 Tax=Celerinatantimonas yamalensis TaxID=559956 RepID=A0ABW9G2A4_9GAMM
MPSQIIRGVLLDSLLHVYNAKKQSLEEKGVITGYHAHTKSDSNQTVMVYLALTFRPLSCQLVQPYIDKVPEIKLAHSISGNVDLMLLVEATTTSEAQVLA